MSRITDKFSNRKAFIAYLMAGDPTIDATRGYVLALADAGADIIEVGMPFSDPIAEGEVIQAANGRALSSGTTLEAIFTLCASLKSELSAENRDVPLVLMGYLNPIFRYGYDAFFERCRECGVSGVIIPDLPFEEKDEVSEHCERYGIDVITLIAPTSGERVARAVDGAQGFIYLVSSLGVTGARTQITTDIAAAVAQLRRHTTLPVAVGFGVHSPEQAAKIRESADGVIVGSAIVDIIAQGGDDVAGAIGAYVRGMIDANHE
ncbi:MAG: tryptophan synthase subunit alpha [Oscillospiraceae bacterium]|jgi:tryptophan synthase alpha chain|nr:tryptophan synthase subunit alpha [Oscillospiraceae bacterium]